MKILVENYTFDASEKKVTFTDYNPVVLERVLIITNVTDGIIIYNFADPAKLGTAATNVLTLAYNTATMDDADKLQIFYDDPNFTAQIENATYVAGQSLVTIGGVRNDADVSPVSADGDVHPFVFEETGRLKVATYPGSVATFTGNITSNGATVALDVSRYSNLMIHCKGTFSTVNCAFEGSIDGGTTWFSVRAVRSSTNTIETTTGNLSAAPTYAWELSVNALTNFRLRATAYTSGTQIWVIAPGTYATEPIPAIQSHAVTLAAASTAIAKAEDSASASANVGVPSLVVRADTTQSNAGVSANGDYAFMFCDVDGRVYTTAKITESALPTGASTSAKQDTIDASINTLLKPASTLTAVTTVGTITNVVHVDDNAGALTVDGTVAVTSSDLAAVKTAVEILDNIVAGSEAQVDVVTLPVGHNIIDSGTLTAVTSITNAVAVTNAGLAALAGAISGTEVQVDVLSMPAVTVTGGLTDAELRATAVPVSLASVPSHAVTNAGTFAVQATLQAGSAAIGKLAANSGVDIGDVDVTSAIITGGATAHDAADAGNPIKIGGRASTTPVTAVAANDRVDAFFDVQGRQIVAQKALTGTLSNVSGSASSVTILAANTARLGATVYNDSTAILYLKFGATASATSFTVKMQADAYYEVPFGYYGIIDGIWASATGTARVTEIT